MIQIEILNEELECGGYCVGYLWYYLFGGI